MLSPSCLACLMYLPLHCSIVNTYSITSTVARADSNRMQQLVRVPVDRGSNLRTA
jgi:hypothetical protein